MMIKLETDMLFSGDYRNTAKGDLQTISELDNIKQAIYLRLITSPGEIIHRQDFGVGIKSFMNKPCTDNNKQRLINKIKLNLIREKRINKINKIVCDWNESLVSVTINVMAFGTELNMNFEVMK
jgi:phage baseplate assembly protein W